MEFVRWNDACPYGMQPTVITLGYFDGLHQGHRALMEKTRQLADECAAIAVVMSFEPHPSHVLPGLSPVPTIYGMDEKRWILRETGLVDRMAIMEFEPNLMNMEPETFVEELLIKGWHAAGIVVGDDFRFGRRNRGDAKLLLELCEKTQVRCEIVREVDDEGKRVSSTRIRQVLVQGHMEEANRLLGRPYMMLGSVSHGKGLGHRALIPTVNLKLEDGRQYPACGVYITRTFTQDGSYESVSNIGHNPTVGEDISLRCETHLLEFDEDMYGKEVRVEFYHYLRPEHKFNSMEELREQQMLDIQNVRKYFAEEKGNEQ